MKTIIIQNNNYYLLFFILAFLIPDLAYSQDKKARLEMELFEEDGQKYITGRAFEMEENGNEFPVEEIDLFFYVERTFSDLPLGGIFNTTDENGEVTVEFPSDLPGDENGNVHLILKIIESDDYMDTEIRKTISWGVPLVIDNNENQRTLWSASASAPISLLILVNSLLVIAWGMIIYFVFKIYKISKM